MRRSIALLCILAHLLAVFPVPAKAGVQVSGVGFSQQQTSSLELTDNTGAIGASIASGFGSVLGLSAGAIDGDSIL